MITATCSRLIYLRAPNRTNQAMGSEKKLDEKKVEGFTCRRYEIPVKFLKETHQRLVSCKHLRVSGCGSCLPVPPGSLQAKDALLPCAARKLAKCRLGTDSCIQSKGVPVHCTGRIKVHRPFGSTARQRIGQQKSSLNIRLGETEHIRGS